MGEKNDYEKLEERVDRIEGSVAVYHAKTDERLKTLFQTCERLSNTAAVMLKVALTLLGAVLLVAVFALVYGAVGGDGFNAVARAAQEAR